LYFVRHSIKMKKLICAMSFCLLTGAVVIAQDPNFSQFFASPLTLNPALTGKFDGVYRVAGNYRNQWPTINNAFTTYTASFDAGILKSRIPEYDQFGIGVLGFADDAGNGVLKNNALGLSLAYHKALDENGFHQLGVGFQGAYVGKRLDVTKVTFEDQLTPSGFTQAREFCLLPRSKVTLTRSATTKWRASRSFGPNIGIKTPSKLPKRQRLQPKKYSASDNTPPAEVGRTLK